jgi:exodeoxyribonuclease VII small subunit
LRPSEAILETTVAKPATRYPDIKELSFERSLKELEQIVSRLERGDVELEESITIWERGEALKDHCDRLLKQAEMRVEKITLDAKGDVKGVEPMDAEQA